MTHLGAEPSQRRSGGPRPIRRAFLHAAGSRDLMSLVPDA